MQYYEFSIAAAVSGVYVIYPNTKYLKIQAWTLGEEFGLRKLRGTYNMQTVNIATGGNDIFRGDGKSEKTAQDRILGKISANI